jgi:hypothetical protein
MEISIVESELKGQLIIERFCYEKENAKQNEEKTKGELTYETIGQGELE